MEMMEILSFSSLALPLKCRDLCQVQNFTSAGLGAVRSRCLCRIQGLPELPPSSHKNSPDVVQPWDWQW